MKDNDDLLDSDNGLGKTISELMQYVVHLRGLRSTVPHTEYTNAEEWHIEMHSGHLSCSNDWLNRKSRPALPNKYRSLGLITIVICE